MVNSFSRCEILSSAIHCASDEDLVRRCAAGESRAMEALVERYRAPIYRFLLRLLDSPEDAEEAALEVFVRVWRNAAGFQRRSSFSTWVYRIAGNLARDIYDRRKARPLVPWPEERELLSLSVTSAEEDVLAREERAERASDLRRALDRLNGNDRMLLVLYYLEERDYKELQTYYGVTYPVLKTRLMRARNRLRKLMEPASGNANVSS